MKDTPVSQMRKHELREEVERLRATVKKLALENRYHRQALRETEQDLRDMNIKLNNARNFAERAYNTALEYRGKNGLY